MTVGQGGALARLGAVRARAIDIYSADVDDDDGNDNNLWKNVA